MGLDKAKLIAAFEEIIGWPYASPGTNDRNGIDCSGAFVRAYRLQGAGIYHGSNTIYRKHCSAVGPTKGAKLEPGMAVFKHRSDGKEPSQFRGDGIGNLYHIGLVTSVNPLRIVHATTPAAKADSTLGQWSRWGRLALAENEAADSGDNGEAGYGVLSSHECVISLFDKPGGVSVAVVPRGTKLTVTRETDLCLIPFGRVTYNGQTGWVNLHLTSRGKEGEADGGPAGPFPRAGRVMAANGKPVKLRRTAGLREEVWRLMPAGARVQILGEKGEWYKANYNGHRGYVLKEFITG